MQGPSPNGTEAETVAAVASDCCAGTVNLGGAWRADPGRVGNRNEPALCQVTLCRLPFPAGGDQPRGMAVLPLPAEPAYGRRDAGRTRHHRQPRERAAVGAEVRPGLC